MSWGLQFYYLLPKCCLFCLYTPNVHGAAKRRCPHITPRPGDVWRVCRSSLQTNTQQTYKGNLNGKEEWASAADAPAAAAAADGRGCVVMDGSHKQRKMASTKALRDFPCGTGGDVTYLLLLSAACVPTECHRFLCCITGLTRILNTRRVKNTARAGHSTKTPTCWLPSALSECAEDAVAMPHASTSIRILRSPRQNIHGAG
jgi:hypothetical protein